MAAHRPTCQWCGQPIVGRVLVAVRPPASYLVHEWCLAGIEEYLSNPVNEEEEIEA
jgi:hypothetical protein